MINRRVLISFNSAGSAGLISGFWPAGAQLSGYPIRPDLWGILYLHISDAGIEGGGVDGFHLFAGGMFAF